MPGPSAPASYISLPHPSHTECICTNPIRVMPVVINGLDYPHSNRPFSHNIRHICHPLCPTEPFPSRSCHDFLIITKPFPRSARVRNFSVKRDFSLVTPVTTLSMPNRNFSSERSLNVRSIPPILKILLTIIVLRILGQDFGAKKIGANKMSLQAPPLESVGGAQRVHLPRTWESGCVV